MITKQFILPMLAIIVVACTFSSCRKDEDIDFLTLDETGTILFQGEKYQIISKSNVTYTVDNEFYASVKSNGIITANFVGKTTIEVSNSYETKVFNVVVRPKVYTYNEPNVKFGDTKKLVISRLGQPTTDSGETILYGNYQTKAPILMLQFTDNKLNAYIVAVKTAYSSELGTFLAERYLPIDLDKLIFINGLTSKTTTMGIKAELYNLSYWWVIYVPFKADKSKNLEMPSIPPDLENYFK